MNKKVILKEAKRFLLIALLAIILTVAIGAVAVAVYEPPQIGSKHKSLPDEWINSEFYWRNGVGKVDA